MPKKLSFAGRAVSPFYGVARAQQSFVESPAGGYCFAAAKCGVLFLKAHVGGKLFIGLKEEIVHCGD